MYSYIVRSPLFFGPTADSLTTRAQCTQTSSEPASFVAPPPAMSNVGVHIMYNIILL